MRLAVLVVVSFSTRCLAGLDFESWATLYAEHVCKLIESFVNSLVYRHGKTYASEARAANAQRVFAQNVAKIDRLNADNHGHTLYEVNQFADLTATGLMFVWVCARCGPSRTN